MTVTVDAKTLNSAVSRALGAIRPNKSKYPILQCLRLVAGDAVLSITATDLDVEIVIEMPAQGELPPTCIDAARLSGIAGRLRDRGDVVIKIDKLDAEISAGRARFSLQALDPESWPSIRTQDLGKTFVVAGKDLATLCAVLAPSFDMSGARPYLEGIFLSAGRVNDPKAGDRLLGVATNGTTLHARDIDAEAIAAAGMPAVILPAFTCAAVAKLFGDTERVSVQVGETKIEFVADGIRFTSKLVEGRFPDWRRVTPGTAPQLSFDGKSLSAAVQTALAGRASEKTGKGVRLTFAEAELTITSTDQAAGMEGCDICAFSAIEALPLSEIGVNGNFMAQMIDVLGAETVQLALSDLASPMVLTGAACDDRKIVLMPMRV